AAFFVFFAAIVASIRGSVGLAAYGRRPRRACLRPFPRSPEARAPPRTPVDARAPISGACQFRTNYTTLSPFAGAFPLSQMVNEPPAGTAALTQHQSRTARHELHKRRSRCGSREHAEPSPAASSGRSEPSAAAVVAAGLDALGVCAEAVAMVGGGRLPAWDGCVSHGGAGRSEPGEGLQDDLRDG